MITFVPATLWGMADRGLVREGMTADLNVIDPNTVAPQLPALVADLPAGARRLVQKAQGIKATIVAGQTVLTDGAPQEMRDHQADKADDAYEVPTDFEIFLSSLSHQPCETTCSGRGRPADIRNAGQKTAWNRRMSLPMTCVPGQYRS